jgi:hypothetical protein
MTKSVPTPNNPNSNPRARGERPRRRNLPRVSGQTRVSGQKGERRLKSAIQGLATRARKQALPPLPPATNPFQARYGKRGRPVRLLLPPSRFYGVGPFRKLAKLLRKLERQVLSGAFKDRPDLVKDEFMKIDQLNVEAYGELVRLVQIAAAPQTIRDIRFKLVPERHWA